MPAGYIAHSNEALQPYAKDAKTAQSPLPPLTPPETANRMIVRPLGEV